MFENNAKRLTFKCLALVLLISGLILFSRDSTKALLSPPQSAADGAQLPTVVLAEQEGAPLRIVDTLVETTTPETTVVRVVLQNQSIKTIRALAVITNRRIDFLNLTSRATMLSPTQTKVIEIKYTGEARPGTFNLTVDFVEFADGTMWGTDASNSREKLAGQREGAKAERRRLKELFKSRGRKALSDLLQGDSVYDEPVPPGNVNRSVAWSQGYSGGVGSIRHRVLQALRTGDWDNVELELDKPYDSSEEQRK